MHHDAFTLLDFGANMTGQVEYDSDNDGKKDARYFDWDFRVDAWFAFNNCQWDMYYLAHNYMEGQREEFTYNDSPIMALGSEPAEESKGCRGPSFGTEALPDGRPAGIS